jgi:hypothetical protein
MTEHATLEKKQTKKNQNNSDEQIIAAKGLPSSTSYGHDLHTCISQNQHCLGETFTAFPLQAKFRDTPQEDTSKQEADLSFSTPKNVRVNPYSGTPLHVSALLSDQIKDSFGIKTNELCLLESPEVSQMGARATAQGNVIRFAPSEFQPDTHMGRTVLGHELSHVREQALGSVHAPRGSIFKDQTHEALSNRTGEAFASEILHGAKTISLVNPLNVAIQMLSDPIKVKENSNDITIDAHVKFLGDPADKPIDISCSSITYKQAAIKGIKEHWKGDHVIKDSNGQDIATKKVKVKIIEINSNKTNQAVLNIEIHDCCGISRIILPPGGWSKRNPGKIDLFTWHPNQGGKNNVHDKDVFNEEDPVATKGNCVCPQCTNGAYKLNEKEFSQVAAHEFGHALGLQDVYNDDNFDMKFKSIMNDHTEDGRDKDVDFAMMLKMQKSGISQKYSENTDILKAYKVQYSLKP